MTKAEEFVYHIAMRCQEDGRLAWLLGVFTESFSMMTAICAEIEKMPVEEFQKEYIKTLNPERWPKTDS